jgi:secondary thiamine-phosphate synthase enzyme
MLAQAHHSLRTATHGPGFRDVTREVAAWLAAIGAQEGLLTLFVRHTSASLTIQENADPDVLRDLADALDRLAPRQHPYRHSVEGPDDMPVMEGKMVLGTWQAIYLVEHRDSLYEREIVLHYMGTRRA